MLSFKKFFDWELNDVGKLNMIAVRIKENFVDGKYYKIKDKDINIKEIANILSLIIKSSNNNKIIVRFRDKKFSWNPNFLKNKKIDLRRKTFLQKQKWKTKLFYGELIIFDLEDFFELFITYPYEYSYQDILILPTKKNMLFVISYHGSIWIVSEDKSYLKSVAKLFDKIGCKVTFGDNFT